jgi:glycerophosphoryl diester phosphodiesterase
MLKKFLSVSLSAVLILSGTGITTASADDDDSKKHHNFFSSYKNHHAKKTNIELGPRPFYLVDDMDNGPLKKSLQKCMKRKKEYKRSDFSIGHRGAPLQFPEHTEESYIAAARMGAGILECDVTFTQDRQLVCRHSQCDLHTTTNILATPLAEKCSEPFTPATFDAQGNRLTPATAKCCTSDITLEEFKSLRGKMDAADANATSVAEYLGGTADWRTDLYTQNGTLLSHRESIRLFKKLGVKMTPELKSPSIEMTEDYTQEDYAQQMIDEYKAERVHPGKVFAQSFNLNDVLYWIENEPAFGRQAVYLDGRYDLAEFDLQDPDTWSPSMSELVDMGVKYLAPPQWMLLETEHGNNIVPSLYAMSAKAVGLNLITWTLERSGPLANGGGWYHQSILPAINNDGDTLTVLDVLAQQVGIKGIFSDWPATTTFYANCKGL